MTSKSARELGPGDWILSNFSLMGVSFDDRIDAAAEAGFAGIGLLLYEYSNLLESGRTALELRKALDSRGLVLAEIEALMGWASTDTTAADRALDVACEMADVFGARHLQAIGPYEGSIDDAVRAFARVCDRAARSELRVAIEFLPPNNIPDAGVALEIAEQADRPNGGVCLDVWHHFRGAKDESLIRALPVGRIVSLQLSDGTLEPANPNYMADTMENRVAPGEGEFDLAGFLAMLDEIGCRAPRSFEVLSREYSSMPPVDVARRIAAGAKKLPAPA